MNPGVLYKYMTPFGEKPAIAPPLFATGDTSRKAFYHYYVTGDSCAKHRVTFALSFRIHRSWQRDPRVGWSRRSDDSSNQNVNIPKYFTFLSFTKIDRTTVNQSNETITTRQERKDFFVFQIQSESRLITGHSRSRSSTGSWERTEGRDEAFTDHCDGRWPAKVEEQEKETSAVLLEGWTDPLLQRMRRRYVIFRFLRHLSSLHVE